MIVVDDHLALLVLAEAVPAAEIGEDLATTSLWYLRLVAAATAPPAEIRGPGRLGRVLGALPDPEAALERILHPAGVQASWDAATRTVTCLRCVEVPPEIAPDVAGASARARGERLHLEEDDRRRKRVERRPILGRLANAIDGPNNAGASYLKGAVGEEKFGVALDEMTSHGLFVLHDRRRPRTAANIDHLVIAPSGVWVVDAKRYAGLVTKVDKGGWFRSDIRLVVGGRDRSKLVEGSRSR